MPLVLSHVQDQIGTITFNHYEKRNALSRAFLAELIGAFNALLRERIRVIIIRAHPGAQVWSAGHDINELERPGRDPLGYYDPLEQVIRAIQTCPVPVLALIEGSVWGGACELAFVCDILIGAPSASFTITPARIGIPYNPSGILHLVNLCGLGAAKEMFFTARPVPAERALRLGILNHLVPHDDIDAFTFEIARTITQNSPLSIAVIKEQIQILSNALPVSAATFERIQGLRRLVWDSEDYIEGKQAFLEKRPPVFQGK
ncbi:MAG: methylmalonyl-CoA decarboxylase [Desulfobacca sp.]|uniref:methylmalonyl-CoA decarboxylase n=1 Tax=Desulfobacca sp. TaxID=2067990 RepID=UPI004048F1B9